MASSGPFANSSIQLWLDFNGTLPAVIPPCQPWDNANGLTNSPNVTFQNCTGICNFYSELIDPLRPNNLALCGLWASAVAFEKSVRPSTYNEDLALFMSLGLDHQDISFMDFVQLTIGSVLGDMYSVAKAGTSSLTFTVPGPCTTDRLFPKDTVIRVYRYAAPSLWSK